MPGYEYVIKVRALPVDYRNEKFIYDSAALLYYPDPPSDQPEYPDYFVETCKSRAEILSLRLQSVFVSLIWSAMFGATFNLYTFFLFIASCTL